MEENFIEGSILMDQAFDRLNDFILGAEDLIGEGRSEVTEVRGRGQYSGFKVSDGGFIGLGWVFCG